jgi:hypothetical protein
MKLLKTAISVWIAILCFQNLAAQFAGRNINWLSKGNAYLFSDSGNLYKIDIEKGSNTLFLAKEKLTPAGKKEPFTLGGDISVTAGPVGRSSSATTDYKLEAEVYSYSRSKGIFAGISLSGSALDVDAKANKNFYSEDESAEDIFSNKDESENASIKDIKQTLGEMDDQ